MKWCGLGSMLASRLPFLELMYNSQELAGGWDLAGDQVGGEMRERPASSGCIQNQEGRKSCLLNVAY